MRSKREIKFEGDVKLYKCTSCGEFLSHDKFSKNKKGYDCIMSECRKCSSKRVTEYMKKNKDKRNAYQREYGRKKEMLIMATGPQPIPEPSYPQPGPQPIPEPIYPQPGPAVQPKGLSAHQSQSDGVGQPAKVVVNFEETTPYKLTPTPEHEPVITKSTPVVPLTFSNDVVPLTFLTTADDSDIIIQSAIEKYPEAYTEILSDEDVLYYFNEKRSTDKKIEELQKRQEKFDREKKEKEYNVKKEKMRDLVDATLSIPEKMKFEDKLHSLHEEQQDIFVSRVALLSTATFPILREEIFDKLLENQTGKTSLSI